METGKPAWLDLAQHDITTTPRASPPARLRIHEGRNAQPSPQLMEKEGSHSPPPLPPPPSAQIPSRHPSCLQVKAGRLKNDRTSPSPVSLLLLSAGELIGFFLIRKTRGQKERKKERKKERRKRTSLVGRSVAVGLSRPIRLQSLTRMHMFYVLRTRGDCGAGPDVPHGSRNLVHIGRGTLRLRYIQIVPLALMRRRCSTRSWIVLPFAAD